MKKTLKNCPLHGTGANGLGCYCDEKKTNMWKLFSRKHNCEKYKVVRCETEDRIYYICHRCLRGWHISVEQKSLIN